MKPRNGLHRLQERWSRLTSTKRETVRQWARFRTDRTRWLRSGIILAGSGYRAVARQLDCSDGTVRRVVDRFLDRWPSRPPERAAPKPEVRELLLLAARLGPKALGYPWNYWTPAGPKEFLRQETGRVVSITTVWRWLKRLGIRRMRVAPKAPTPVAKVPWAAQATRARVGRAGISPRRGSQHRGTQARLSGLPSIRTVRAVLSHTALWSVALPRRGSTARSVAKYRLPGHQPGGSLSPGA